MAVRHTLLSRITPWAAVAFLILVFLSGGGSRHNSLALIVLRPAAAIAAVLFIAQIDGGAWRRHQPLIALTSATLAALLLQLVPLPPVWWQMLPGHGLLRDIDVLAGTGAVWRPWSMVPWRTTNALFSCLIPIAAMAAVITLPDYWRSRIVLLLIVMALASGLLGVLQIIGDPDSPLFLHAVTNNGEAVGLFANRNHQALLLAALMPLLAAFASADIETVEQARLRLWCSVAIGAITLPLILIVGSRAGLFLGVLGVASVPFVYRRPAIRMPARRSARAYRPVRIAAAIGTVTLLTLFFVFARAPAIDRLLGSGGVTERRPELWQRSWALLVEYLPFGTGFGTFEDVYQLDLPRRVLTVTVANHAHNDWLEVAIGGGVAGLALLTAALVMWTVAVLRLWRNRANAGTAGVLARAGSAIILIGGAGSFVDYPARVPSLAALFAIAAVWMSSGAFLANPVFPSGSDGDDRERQSS